MAELRPYEPTWRDRLASMMMGDGRASPERRRFVEGLLGSTGLGNTGMGLVDVTPVGGLLQAQEAVREGDPRGAALAVLPIPGAAKAKGAAASIDDLRTMMSQKYPNVTLDLAGKSDGPLIVSRIVVPAEQRGQGVGSAAMRDILDFADQQGRTVALTPDASFGTPKGKLIDWYGDMGFRMNKGRSKDYSISELMLREPQTANVAADVATPQRIRAYHGSPNEFEQFDINKAGSNRDPGALGRALYFSTDNVVAEGSVDRGKRYGGYPHKYEVDITPRNPLMLEHPGPGASWSAKMDALSKELGLEPPKTKEEWATWADTASKVARERGHDAIVYDYAPMNYNQKEIAVLDDSIINILRKYGLVPGMIGGGAAGFGLLGPVDASAAER